MDSSSRKGMPYPPAPRELILDVCEQELINQKLENMNNQLAQLNNGLKPSTVAVDMARLKSTTLSLYNQVVTIQRVFHRAALRAYQQEEGDLYTVDLSNPPTFLDETTELETLPDPDEYITAYEAAAILKITLKTLYKRLKDKSLPGTKILGKWYIRKDTLSNMLNGNSSVKG